MRRRDFIKVVGGGAFAWPLTARAQQPDRVRRIGVMTGSKPSDPESQSNFKRIRQRLKELGREEGRNLHIEARWWAGDAGLADAQAAELVALDLDVILAFAASWKFLKKYAKTVPIVFAVVTDPVGLGLVQSLAKPGGNFTGFTTFEPGMAGKWLQLLKQAAPDIRRVAAIFDPQTSAAILMPAVEAASRLFQLQLIPAPAHDAAGLEGAISGFAEQPHGSLLIFPGVFPYVHRELIVSLASTCRLPAMYPFPLFVTAGGLMSYGVRTDRLAVRSVDYVDRILRGAHAADLPVQEPNEFQFLINLKTANALELTIPEELLATADKVIE